MSISINARAAGLVSEFAARAEELRLGVSKGELGETLIDAGARHVGGISAGLLLAGICMGGLGEVSLTADAATPRWPWSIAVHSSNPVIACLASQYAGWRLSHGEGRDGYFALGSGPRARVGAKGAAVRRTRLRRPGERGRVGDRERSGAALRAGREGRGGLRAGAFTNELHSRADPEPRGRLSGGRARARGCAAQDP